MKKVYFLILFLYFFKLSFSQHTPMQWILGGGTGNPFNNQKINFSNNSVQSLAGINNGLLLTSAAIGSLDSNLLFYTNGVRIFNAQNAILQNGDTLSPCAYTYANMIHGLGLAQMAVFIPDPADSNRFYLFHASADITYYPCNNFASAAVPNKLYYTLIDKTLDNANGGVVSKNNIISNFPDTFGNSLLAIKHGNGRDWWIIACSPNQPIWTQWLISPMGIVGPIKQTIGNGTCGGYWNLKFNALTNTIAGFRTYFIWPTTRYIDLYNFDRCTGLLSNGQTLQMVNQAKYSYAGGCEFSESGNYLYGCAINKLYQFDMLAPNIQASMIVVDSVDSLDFGNYKMWGVSQIGPDGRIYSKIPNGIQFLSVINYPDSGGIACNAVHGGIALPNYHYGDLPNIPLYELGPLVGSVCDTLTGMEQISLNRNELLVYPNPASDQLTIGGGQLANGKGVTVKVYDVLGKIQLQQKTTATTIDIRNLSPGIYMLQAQQGNRVLNGKFVKE